MVTTIITVRTALRLDATLIAVVTNGVKRITKYAGCDRLPQVDYSDWMKFSPIIEDTEYKFVINYENGYELDETLSYLEFGYRGSRGYFVGPGTLKRIALSDIHFNRVNRY